VLTAPWPCPTHTTLPVGSLSPIRRSRRASGLASRQSPRFQPSRWTRRRVSWRGRPRPREMWRCALRHRTTAGPPPTTSRLPCEHSTSTASGAHLVLAQLPRPTQTVSFDGSGSTTDASTSIVSYDWLFGDGGAEFGARTLHAYPLAGSYIASWRCATASARPTPMRRCSSVTPSARILPLCASKPTSCSAVARSMFTSVSDARARELRLGLRRAGISSERGRL